MLMMNGTFDPADQVILDHASRTLSNIFPIPSPAALESQYALQCIHHRDQSLPG